MNLHKIVKPQLAISLLRYSLALTFLWFGLLKLFDVSPIKDIILTAVPSFMSDIPMFYWSLAMVEILIGVGLLVKKLAPYAALVLIGHLIIATGSVLVSQGFKPYFPILTFPGEFVVKNLVLMAGAIVIISEDKAK